MTADLSLLELILAAIPKWVEDAVCAQTDPEAYFPDGGSSAEGAKAVCFRCPVRRDCLAHAVAFDEEEGVWGGFTSLERERMASGQKPVRCAGPGCTRLLVPPPTDLALRKRYCGESCSRKTATAKQRVKRHALEAEQRAGGGGAEVAC